MPASDVGQRLREARKAAGLTLRELAERAALMPDWMAEAVSEAAHNPSPQKAKAKNRRL